MGFLDRFRDERMTIRREEPVPLEGTRMDLFNSIIPNWYAENWGTSVYGTADLTQRVWVANRCQQLNSQQISSMRLEWHGSPGTQEPLWVSNPDPNVFGNGIGDAMFCIVDQLYGWGWSLLYVTDYYADGYPRAWTVIPSGSCEPRWGEDGRREYKLGEDILDPSRVVQIDRNPTTAAHGTSALRAYAQNAWGLLAAGNQSMTTSQGAIPQMYLQSLRKLTPEQALSLQEKWMERTTSRGGAPPVVPPEIEPKTLSINPADLALLDTQEWNARVLATAYGVPSVVLNMGLQGSGLTYTTAVGLMQTWWLTELRTVSKRIMDAFSTRLLPAGQSVTQDATDITIEGSIEAEDDPQLLNAAKASPAQQPGRLTAVTGG